MDTASPTSGSRAGRGELVRCSVHEGYVDRSEAITLHGGRGGRSSVTCIRCMLRSTQAWQETGCPFCLGAANRMQAAIETYVATGEPFTLPEVRAEELPAHDPNCPWVDDVLPGQATS
jgi:hypothetical protein